MGEVISLEVATFRRRSQQLSLVNLRAEVIFYTQCLRDTKMEEEIRQTYLDRLQVLRELLGEANG